MEYIIYSNNQEYTEIVGKELKVLPDWLLQDFYDYGGKLIVGKTMPKGHENKAGAFVGVFSQGVLREGTARIYINEAFQNEHAVYHEIGHYFYYRYSIFDNKFVFDQGEMKRFVKEFCYGNSYYLDEKEFFAESFNRFFQGKLTEENYPVTVSQLNELWNE